jgi:hypothetical protein
MVDDILKEMSPRFAKLYADRGRSSISSERLLRAQLLQILYTVRSERLLKEEVPRRIAASEFTVQNYTLGFNCYFLIDGSSILETEPIRQWSWYRGLNEPPLHRPQEAVLRRCLS